MPKFTFTNEDLLVLRWCVFDAKDSLPVDQRKWLLEKIDKMLDEEGQRLVIERMAQPAAARYERVKITARDW